MASKAFPSEDLVCPVCMDIFQNPVGLKCSHVFCKDCLHKWWDRNQARECPTCRDKTTRDRAPGSVSKEASESLCRYHGERLKLFCLSDEELICVICQTSETHEDHKLRPIKEAALKFKAEIGGALRPLQEKLEAFNEEKQKSDQALDFIKSQAECTAIQIQEEFEKLHQFLRDEEAARIAALREEEEQKSQKMKERVETMTKEISSLSATTGALELELKADDVSFLQNYKATKNGAEYQVSDPEKVPGGRIDVAKHLSNLKYRVWEKMQKIVQYTPVTLDPNTTRENLTVSVDLTSLQYGEETEPSSEGDDDDDDDDDDDNDGGFIAKGYVFGSEGFMSGTHCWDVEVGDSPVWALGVAENSCDEGDPKLRDTWGVGYGYGEYHTYTSATTTKLTVRREVEKVRVLLDWDRGRLSFSDPNNNTSLHTVKRRFTGRVFPWFSVGSAGARLRICPLKVSITAE